MKLTIKNKKAVKIFRNRWFIFFATGFFVAIIFISVVFVGFNFYYKDKILPRVRVNNIVLSGKTTNEGVQILQRATNSFIREGIFFKYKDKEVIVPPIISSADDPDLSKEIFSFDLEKTINEAYSVGRGNNPWINFKEKIITLLEGRNIKLYYYINKKELSDILLNNFSTIEDPGEDADLIVKYTRNKYKITIKSEKLGRSFDYKLAVNDAQKRLSLFSLKPIEMYMRTDYPMIKEDNIKSIIPQMQEILNNSPFSLKFFCQIGKKEDDFCQDKDDINIAPNNFSQWLKVVNKKGKPSIALNKERLSNYIKLLSDKINIPAQDAEFKIEDNKVMEFKESKDGIVIDAQKTFNDIKKSIFIKSTSTAKLFIKKDLAKNKMKDVNDFGISSLIGTGSSNFSGSPQNRRHNIEVGAKKLDGLLIKPGEEFSLVSSLGDIDKESGYLPELVIKGNKTVPEYGGGLCQIATTAFRLALNTGLPITERRSHAYRVSYYEPAGTDATIYVPKPDLRFINDTKKYLLIQTKIDGDNLIFNFWGTPDSRKVELSDPVISNIVVPGPAKIIETEDLAPGEKKCTERSHNGADAEFTRKIIYNNGEEKEESWFSRYRPWQAVCLVGKDLNDDNALNNKEASIK